MLGGEWPTTDPSGIRLDHSNRRPNRFRRDSQASANPSNSGRRRSDIRVRPEINIQHQRIGSLDEDVLPSTQSRVDVSDAIDDERLQPRRQFLDRERTLSVREDRRQGPSLPCIEVFPLQCHTRNARIVCIGLRPTCGIWQQRSHRRRGGAPEGQIGKPSRSTQGRYPSSWFRCYPQNHPPRQFFLPHRKRKTDSYLDPPSSTSLRPSTI